MKCEKICDLLKSDYLDQELTAELRREIDEHLVQCPGCRSLKEELDSWRVALRGLGQREVPAVVWQNIQDKILKEHAAARENSFGNLRDSLRKFFSPRQPVFAMAASVVVLIIAVLTLKIITNQPNPLIAANGEDIFGDYRLNGIGETYNFGTEIEEYFL